MSDRPNAPAPALRDIGDLSGQTAVITGSTSGIGLALARASAKAGATVILNGLGDAAEIESTRATMETEFGVRVLYHGANMLHPEQITDMIAFAGRETGRLDILVNNAGIQHVEAIENFPVEKWDQIIAINLTSAFHAIRTAAPIMKAQGRGRIVNMASAHGLVASAFKSAYVASKHGVVGLTKAVALELARDNITCNAICPGFVHTPIVDKQIEDQARMSGISRDRVIDEVILAKQPSKQFITPEALVGMFLYLVSDAGAGCSGAAYPVDGGWTAQ